MTEIASPCVNICRVEIAKNICTGCGRTPVEIFRWSEMSQEQRDAVMARLAAEWPGPSQRRNADIFQAER